MESLVEKYEKQGFKSSNMFFQAMHSFEEGLQLWYRNFFHVL